ncbi:MAG TPA: xanthine dehydrogenase family protein molybdopterin-binding subunit [Alphaproteobacteria bacterium]|jgi:carbon-monoxide dehydrogenase large subunit|nr:xanthine dehydrogenase family protein molybdopterin-binding subunit [Alphaproteobacteria bacterium]
MSKFGMGQPVPRTEDPRFITGRGRYVDDIVLPHMAHAVMVYSPHAHAEIVSIDAEAARRAPGVLAVLTGKELQADGLGTLGPRFMPEDMGGPKGYRTVRPLVATDRVRYVGERVAVVVAETRDQARDAAELIEIDYKPLPAVTSSSAATAAGAPQLYPGAANNVSFTLRMGDKAKTDAAFAKADHVARVHLFNNRLSANSMEPRSAMGAFDPVGDGYTLYTSTQNPHGIRSELAAMIFKVPETRVRVVAPDVGGGFGMKGSLYPEEALVLWAAKRTGRPVKWIAQRSEGLMSDDHGRDQVFDGEMALDKNGRILGVRAKALHNVGAYISGGGAIPLVFSLMLLPGVYDIQTYDVQTSAVLTNTAPTSPYRGAGRPEAIYAIERLLEQAARDLGIDRAEIRRRNFVRPEQMPHTSPGGFTYDSGEFAVALDQCLALADYKGFAARRAESEKRGKRRGLGISYYVDNCNIFNERMELRVDQGGNVTILAGTFSHGQGHETAYAQLVSDWLGVPFETIRFIQGDTNEVSLGRGTYASRSATVGGAALKSASDLIITKGKKFAAFAMEVSEGDIDFKDGRFTVAGTDKSMTIAEVAAVAHRPAHVPVELGIGLDAVGNAAGEPPNFPNGCHICELEVDPDTGHTEILSYTVVDDVGRVINPLLVAGQIHGGIAQGIGQALLENVHYDAESGQLLSGSFMDYGMPRSADIPLFKLGMHEVPCRTNPLGVKGAGEAGTVGAPPCVIGGILDALSPLGVAHLDMPATPERVWQAIQAARGKAA